MRVLEADPDLAMDLGPLALPEAKSELIASALPVPWSRHSGAWGPTRAAGHFGLLVLEGLMLREVRLLGTSSAEILGEGDLLRPWDGDGEFALMVEAEVDWMVLEPVEVAILNAEFLRRAARWPEVLARLTARALGRARALAFNDAITHLKHVEARLLALFSHLAERWGTVGRDGIRIWMPVTHEILAKLVGATRPSVTTGLGRLAARGLLVRQPDGVWRLRHDGRNAVEPWPAGAWTRLPA